MKKRKNIQSMFLSKLVLSYSVVILLVLLIVSVVIYQYSVQTYQKVANVTQTELTDKTLSQVENYLGEMNAVASQIMVDERIISMFKQLQEDQAKGNHFDIDIMANIDIGSILTSLNGPAKPIWRISVYNQYGDFISSGASVTPYSNVEQTLSKMDVEYQMTKLMSGGQKNRIILEPQPDRWCTVYNESYISLLRPISTPFAVTASAIVEIQQEVSKLVEYVNFDVLENMTLYLFDDHGHQILPVDTTDDFDMLDETQVSITTKTSNTYGWKVSLVQPNDVVNNSVRPILFYLIFIEIIVAAILILAIYFITRRISAPLLDLSRTVNGITIENMSSEKNALEPVSKGGNDEISRLHDAFQMMLQRLEDSVKYEKKAYLLALQSQMDPHFLYNMLAVLSSIGMEEGSDKIVETCDRMSSILRYISTYHDGQQVTVKDEINNVNNYLALMKTRYEDYFSFTITTDGKIDNMNIPRLTLQPLIENCFKHGFAEVEPPWNIHLTAGLRGLRWYVEVVDNGSGFDRKSIDAIKQKIKTYSENIKENYQEMKIGGLGVVNTVVRLKMVYGKNVDFYVYNIQPTGCCITLEGDVPEDL